MGKIFIIEVSQNQKKKHTKQLWEFSIWFSFIGNLNLDTICKQTNLSFKLNTHIMFMILFFQTIFFIVKIWKI